MHIFYEEEYPERSFFIFEAIIGGIWPIYLDNELCITKRRIQVV